MNQIIHVQDTEAELSINWINNTKFNVESNHHFKYPGQNTNYGIEKIQDIWFSQYDSYYTYK